MRLLIAFDVAVALVAPFLGRALLLLPNGQATVFEAIVLATLGTGTLGLSGEYARRPRPRDGGLRRLGRVLLLAGFSEWIATFVVSRFESDLDLAPMYVTWLLLAGGWIWGRAVIERIDRPGVERAVIVGSGRIANRVATLASRHSSRKISVTGYLDDDPAPTDPIAGRHLGGIDQLALTVAGEQIDLVIVAFSRRSDESLLRALRACDWSGVDVVVVPRLFDVLPPFARSYDLGGLALFDASARAAGVSQAVVKRTLDIVGAGLALALLAPLFALIALAIYVDDRSPLIFRQRRIGRGGKPFTILKFRTLGQLPGEFDPASIGLLRMDETIEVVKRAAAARPTRVGSLLRRTSADELPQLWNVLRGDMSLVGPRPLRAFEVDALDDWQRMRHLMRPGMTGLWQVMGRSDVRWDERLQLDCAYVRNWSLVADLGILARTLPAVLLGRGAL